MVCVTLSVYRTILNFLWQVWGGGGGGGQGPQKTPTLKYKEADHHKIPHVSQICTKKEAPSIDLIKIAGVIN